MYFNDLLGKWQNPRSRFWEPNSRWAGQEVPLLLQNTKFQVPNSEQQSLHPIPTHINSEQPSSSFLKIHLTNVVPSTFRSSTLFSPLRHCDTGPKVAGSIPDGVIGIFYRLNPFGRTMTLGFTQPLTEMSTTNISGGVGLTTLPPSCAYCLKICNRIALYLRRFSLQASF
jgi:hypothetical protein